MLKIDCAYFKGDRPCKFHKEDGRKCDDCNYFQPIAFKILIIKLDAVGDVLRTTSILYPLKKKYPESYIVWCTRHNSKELFCNNSLVDDVILVEDDAFFRINAEEFDIVINLDTSKISSAIAASAVGKDKIGFILNKIGFVEPTSSAANKWLFMSAFDDIKRKNEKTYQQNMYDILELDSEVAEPIFNITEETHSRISAKLHNWSFKKDLLTIGLNLGVGTKWPSKGWPLKNWEKLITHLQGDKFNLLLLGGPDEKEALKRLKSSYPFLINTGSENSVIEFAAIIDLCDLIVTADTLALHVATALEKKIVSLFGPTSSNEIELFGKGIKLRAGDECKCYYNKYCTESVSCMEKITGEQVYSSVKSLLGRT